MWQVVGQIVKVGIIFLNLFCYCSNLWDVSLHVLFLRALASDRPHSLRI